MPVNPYDCAGRTDIVRASYTRRKANVKPRHNAALLNGLTSPFEQIDLSTWLVLNVVSSNEGK